MLHDLLVLPEIPESLIEVLHARYIDIQPEENSRIQELVEIIADVRQPMVMIATAQNKEEKRQWELKVIPQSCNLIPWIPEVLLRHVFVRSRGLRPVGNLRDIRHM